jgi:hypothetical protein
MEGEAGSDWGNGSEAVGALDRGEMSSLEQAINMAPATPIRTRRALMYRLLLA